ncbi:MULTISPECIES: Ku protein [Stutzerimonas stutzeri subgroup]|jgi:DNA end-binding protein Ku|uniref:Ku protein n=1 Tax=Stutzerimonas chloritidismutans TaxID=203192 RepID=A0ACC5VP68_STUCH|nr:MULTISPECIES: Ku protein [Stutzerimonas stutzeri group]KJS29598.1 MAG: DNA repair protein [Pseudomonas sp. BRH_c35]KKJ96709.1 DNA repair protein [Stutzerimonas stutzeri]MAK85537.1 Ku protein [Pseudomonas sp.]MBU0919009.1 Ku protein [Gammaproteobacteria bacterium]PKM13855.1 MAG: Ku protein [Gammaproteobacteria bacterium HGW-Gammaproteobacteria-5]CEG51653.1 putative DNA repair protein PSPTO_3465 [Stutzerimonas xanthomarina]
MPRTIWKGAVSFGLVHIPVALVPATTRQGIDFDWLDKRSMDRVGYKRINKTTGEDIDSENIVKGVEYEKGHYVVISDDEIKGAHPKATQTVDIVAFVDAKDISFLYIDTPYYLTPDRRGEKVYALLRETLIQTGKVGIANVVLRNKQHLAVVMPLGKALVMNTLRWADEVRGVEYLELKDEALDPDLAERELDMAKRLVEDMTEKWKPEQYKDTFQDQIMELVEKKAREGKLEAVGGPEEAVDRRSADVIDLTELLKRSLAAKPGKASKEDDHEEEEKAPAKPKTASKAKTSKSSSAASRTRKAPAAGSKSSKKAS